ncbi:MAG TPA: RCC1 domain-containing protein, partial [Dissulfurispiraceae bacterium]|nr:RCC1 domain-containing protein [Dissulfurispiraceae bacterium]
MGYTGKSFAATVFVVFTTICLVLVGYDNSMGSAVTGKVLTWGENLYGQLGNGTTTDSSTPVQASGLRGVIAIAGGDHSLAVEADGTIWAWGF